MASDPSGILAYNWQVGASSMFAKIARQDSVMAPRGGTSFHPWESFGLSWNGVAGATKYVLDIHGGRS